MSLLLYTYLFVGVVLVVADDDEASAVDALRAPGGRVLGRAALVRLPIGVEAGVAVDPSALTDQQAEQQGGGQAGVRGRHHAGKFKFKNKFNTRSLLKTAPKFSIQIFRLSLFLFPSKSVSLPFLNDRQH